MREDPQTRSRIMRAVKGENTTPELIVRRVAFAMGYRFRLHRRDLPGKPDLVFSGRRKVIFVHGCFWHGHDCSRGARMPKTHADYWRMKITRNRLRDAASINALNFQGWRAAIVWECELRNLPHLQKRLARFLK